MSRLPIARERRCAPEPSYFTRSDLIYALALSALLPITAASLIALALRML